MYKSYIYIDLSCVSIYTDLHEVDHIFVYGTLYIAYSHFCTALSIFSSPMSL